MVRHTAGVDSPGMPPVDPLGTPRHPSRPGQPGSLRGLVRTDEPLRPGVRTLAAFDRFSSDPNLFALAVVDEQHVPIGLLNRFRFLERLSRPFGRDLLSNQSVECLMERAPLVVDEEVSLERVNDILADHEHRYIFDGFIVTREGRYLGTGTGHDLMRRLTERRHAELSHLAYHDPLTDLPNRQLFQDRLQQAIAAAARNQRQLALFYVDLDRFKAVNDTLGHAAGDALLLRVADRFRALVRAQDTVSRLSGDEFAMIVTELTTAGDATIVAKKILDLFRDPFPIDGQDICVSCSVGVALFPDHADHPVALMRMADDALYRAKRSRNRYERYSSEMARSSAVGPLVFDTVRRAIQGGHLEVHYQPQADLRTGRITGLEALVRWNDPARGLVPTAELVRLAEDTGLMSELTDYVTRVALRQWKAWQRRGLVHGIRLGLNISGMDVRDGVLEPMLAGHLAALDLPMSVLDLEITETALMDSDGAGTAVLLRLRQGGARVSVDDFGTGYSSLRRLQRLPVDTLKIDKTFIDQVGRAPREGALACAIISMAHSLGLSVVAEGVENDHQFVFLREHQCDAYQGFRLSRPLPAVAVEALLGARTDVTRAS